MKESDITRAETPNSIQQDNINTSEEAGLECLSMVENLYKDSLSTFLKTLSNEEVEGGTGSNIQKGTEDCGVGSAFVYQGGELCPVVVAEEDSANSDVQSDLRNGICNEETQDSIRT